MNVHELQNRINRAVLLASTNIITPFDFLSPEELAEGQSNSSNTEVPLCVDQPPYKEAKEEVITSFTSSYLANALTKSSGNVSTASRASGMERQAFQRLMRRYHIQSQDFRQN